MKKFLFCMLVVVLGLASCTGKKTTFNVNVSLKNADEKMIYLQKVENNELVKIDSATFVNETASMIVPVGDAQTLYVATIQGARDMMPFFADNKDISIVGDMQNIALAQIIGSESQQLLNDYNTQFNAFYDELRALYPIMEKAYNENDTVVLDSLDAISEAVMGRQQDFRDNFIANNAGSFVSHYIVNQAKHDIPLDQLKKTVELFGTENNTIYLEELNGYISSQERLEIGQPFIDFTVSSIDSTLVTLSERIGKSKLLLVDFWASWCGPCRQENPVVLAAYNKYHDKGFDVIGISVDRKAEDWMKAVEQDQLPWTQLRDAENTASADYMIYYIPSNFLFDENGIIIAKNLRGEDLQNKLAELLGE